jgi:hypothetical protein
VRLIACVTCGKETYAQRPTKRYCSRQCQPNRAANNKKRSRRSKEQRSLKLGRRCRFCGITDKWRQFVTHTLCVACSRGRTRAKCKKCTGPLSNGICVLCYDLKGYVKVVLVSRCGERRVVWRVPHKNWIRIGPKRKVRVVVKGKVVRDTVVLKVSKYLYKIVPRC